MLSRLFLLFGLLVLLSACSSIYHPKDSYVPEGYYEKKISDQVYEVYFQAYRRENWEELESMLLQRTIELVREQGYQAFETGDVKRTEEIETVSIPPKIVPGVIGVGGGATEAEPPKTDLYIPGYTRDYRIRTVSFRVTFLE